MDERSTFRLTRRAVMIGIAGSVCPPGRAANDTRTVSMPQGQPRFIEVSHVIEPGMVTYPGLPAPEAEIIVDHDSSRSRYQNKSEFLIASLHLCGNTGTYVDAPIHRHRGATDLAGLPLERLAHVPVRVFDARSLGRAVGPQLFRNADLRGAAVLVRTDFSQYWRTDRYTRDNPYLTAQACELLAQSGAAFVGIDSVNIDDMADLSRPAHTGLLAAGIPIIEHMTGLDRLPDRDFRFHGAPIAVAGMGTFPIRAYALVGRRE
jgi:arylformamidase